MIWTLLMIINFIGAYLLGGFFAELIFELWHHPLTGRARVIVLPIVWLFGMCCLIGWSSQLQAWAP